MKKHHYFAEFSSLDFAAEIIKTPIEWTEDDLRQARGLPSGVIYGPFNTLKEARDYTSDAINQTIDEYRSAKAFIKSNPPTEFGV
jgi:hypothetical protein